MGTRAEDVGQRLINNQIDNRLLSLLVNIFTCKGTFCCKHLQRSVLQAVQCFSIYFIAGYIISIGLIAHLNQSRDQLNYHIYRNVFADRISVFIHLYYRYSHLNKLSMVSLFFRLERFQKKNVICCISTLPGGHGIFSLDVL